MKTIHAVWELENIGADAWEILLDAGDTPEMLAEEEKRIIAETLARCGGNRTAAMEQLGLSKTVFYGKLKEYQIG